MTETRLKIAVFVDFDNIEIGVKTTLSQQFDISVILEAIKERGEVVTKVAYGDWKRAGDHGRLLSQHAIRLVQRNLTPGGDKNGADINLALDALEMAFTHHHINAFVIVGGDSDFITLVEKLKQYDKKVFVVGGRQFTSMVMQKNCHEFIAYENLVGGRSRSGTAAERRSAAAASADITRALPLVKRALKVLVDREVTPQLGLLKSTLLQLDSTFSEREYGVSTFRDFIEKVAQTGTVTLRNAGRSLLVDLADGNGGSLAESAASSLAPEAARTVADGNGQAAQEPAEASPASPAAPATPDAEQARQAVETVQSLFARGTQAPRWPMYVRQVKQYLRGVDESFDERGLGFSSIVDLLRACQRENVLRLERDRQGGLRVFPGSALARSAPAPIHVETPGTEAVPEPIADAAADEETVNLAENDAESVQDTPAFVPDRDEASMLEPRDLDVAADSASPAADTGAASGEEGTSQRRRARKSATPRARKTATRRSTPSSRARKKPASEPIS